MAAVHMKIVGGRELEAGFRSLMDDFDVSKTTVKNTMKRGLVEALQPMADVASSLAPDDPETGGNDLRHSIVAGTKLTPRQARLAKKDSKNFVTVYAGTADPAGLYQEFGTVNHGPQPFMRPAFAQEAKATIDRVVGALQKQLAKATARAKAKALKKAG